MHRLASYRATFILLGNAIKTTGKLKLKQNAQEHPLTKYISSCYSIKAIVDLIQFLAFCVYI